MSKKKTALGLEENVAGLLCYVLGWITGILFLLLEKKNSFVRFHAVQSLVVFLGLTIISVVLGWIPILGAIVSFLIFIVGMILWVLLMVKAYQGEKYEIPVVWDLIEEHISDQF